MEQAVGHHPIQLKVRFQIFLVQIVLLLAQALGVALPVPGLELEILPFGRDQGLQLLGLGLDRRAGRPGELVEKALDRLGRGRHLVLQGVGREAFVAQQPGLFGAKLRDVGDHLAGVIVIALLGPRPAALEQRLAHLAVVEFGQLRLLGGVAQGQRPLAVQAPRPGVLCGGGDLLGVQSR